MKSCNFMNNTVYKMNPNLINQIIQHLKLSKGSIKEDKPKFRDRSYQAIRLNEENFHSIKPDNPDKKIAFIDGGNAEILSSSNFSLNFIRIYYVIYQDNKRISAKKKEFYTFFFRMVNLGVPGGHFCSRPSINNSGIFSP